MSTTLEQKIAIRKSAPANTKLTVSRPARSKRKPPRDVYHGTGNIAALIMENIPKNDQRRKNLPLLRYYRDQILVYADTKNNGVIPEPYLIKRMMENVKPVR